MVAPALALQKQAAAADMYGPDAGKEILPGVRQIDLGKFPIDFGGFKTAVVTDYAAKPGAVFPDDVMKNDMVCVILSRRISSQAERSGCGRSRVHCQSRWGLFVC